MPALLLGPPISESDVELALEELEPHPRGTCHFIKDSINSIKQ